MATILMVDDEPDLRELVRQKFRRQIREQEFEFVFASNGIEALKTLQEMPQIDMVISDINMPEMDGLTLLDRMREQSPNVKAIIVSAYGDMTNIRNAMNRGAFDFTTKPVDFDDLEQAIRRTLGHLEMVRQAQDFHRKLDFLHHELGVASSLQQSVLPKDFPMVDSLQVYAAMEPALDVGGDFYDFFWLSENRLGIIVADVSGKGVTGALFMAITRTLLRLTAPFASSPAACMAQVNNFLSHENPKEMFVTTFYGIIDVKTGEFTFSNGGHCFPVLITSDGQTRFIPGTGDMALGMFEGLEFHQSTITLNLGEMIVLYTDGVTEAMNTEKQEFSDPRLLDALSNQQHQPVKEVVMNLVKEVHAFAGQEPQSDDITCLCFRFSKQAEMGEA